MIWDLIVGMSDGLLVSSLTGIFIVLLAVLSGKNDGFVVLSGIVVGAVVGEVLFSEFFIFRPLMYDYNFAVYTIGYWLVFVIIVGAVWRVVGSERGGHKLYKR